MSAPEIKEKLTTLINNLQDEELLQEIYQMVSEDSVPYGLSEAQKAQISKAKEEIKQGLSQTHDEVKKSTAEWLRK
jgi:predicted transcriptional regulator